MRYGIAWHMPHRLIVRPIFGTFEVSCEKTGSGPEKRRDPRQTIRQFSDRQMAENRLCHREIERPAERRNIEIFIAQQIATRQPGAQAVRNDFSFVACFKKGIADIDAMVMTGKQIWNQFDPGSERATPDVDKPALGFEAVANKKFGLKLANFIPKSTDNFPVPSRAGQFFQSGFVIVYVRKLFHLRGRHEVT